MKIRPIAERELAFFEAFRPLKRHSARRLVEHFETQTKMTRERWDRIELLEKGDAKDRKVARFLDDYDDGKPAPILSCPLLARKVRLWLFAEIHRTMESFRQVFVLHLLFRDAAMPFDALRSVDWRTIAMRLRRQIERAVGRDVVAMGGFELKADYARRMWLPHAHIAVANCTRKKLEALRDYYDQDGQLQIDPVRNPEQLLYAQKLNCFRELKRNGPRRQGSRKRLRMPQLNEFLRWISRYRPTELLFALNVQRGNTYKYRLSDRVIAQLVIPKPAA
jgi:hypothetical protein